MKSNKQSIASFNLNVQLACITGVGLSVVFYGLIYLGPLDYSMVRRYCLSHPVCIATVLLFSIATSALVRKFLDARRQQRWVRTGALQLEDMLITSEEPDSKNVIAWLSDTWQQQSDQLRFSWLGQRISDLLSRQQKRANSSLIDEDIRELAGRDADRQHDSYALVRIVTWAMPMLGFLGTVLGISETLGQMDMQSLASGSQEAMNGLTGGLYVAFDTTAIALILTVVAIFMQFLVQRLESVLLNETDQCVEEYLVPWFAKEELPTPQRSIDEFVEKLSAQIAPALVSIVENQADLWRETISEAHGQWQQLSTGVGAMLQQSMTGAIDSSLEKHAHQLEKINLDGAAHIETRWQQWQTTLSEQTRMLHQQQREMVQQTELLRGLIEKGTDLERMDRALDQNLLRLTDVDRFHDAAICLTEAVAFLGTQMERHGLLGRKAPKKTILKMDDPDENPFQRKRAA